MVSRTGFLRRADFSHIRSIYLRVDGEDLEFPNYPEIARQFAEAIIAGKQICCRYIKLAAKRYLTMLKMARSTSSEFYFSIEHACDFLWFKENLFIGDNFQNKEHAELEPWDILLHSQLFGFRERGTGERFTNIVYAEIPRKHAKTQSAAAISFFDAGYTKAKRPIIQVGAGTKEQADKLFGPMCSIIDNEPDLKKDLSLDYTKDLIRFGKNGGWLETVANVAKHQDGANPSTVILDELHAQKPDIFQVLTSAFGARSNQLLYQITTAGRHASGLAWDQRNGAIMVLEGMAIDWRLCAMIWTLDKEDMENKGRLLTDERLWHKAMPMLGVSVKLSIVRQEAAESKRSPVKREEFLRTRLNIWSNAATALVDMDMWGLCKADTALEYFVGTDTPCYIGVDLSAHLDLTAVGLLFDLGNGRLAVFVKFYIPFKSPTLLSPVNHAQFMEWAAEGLLEIHDKGTVDYRKVESDIRVMCEAFNVKYVGFDKAMGQQIMANLWEDDLPIIDYPNKPWSMTEPTEDIIGHISDQTLEHDGGGLLTWNMGNVVGDRRTDGTVMPKKESAYSERKIDGFTSLAIANGCRINPGLGKNPDDKEPESAYLHRGIIGYRET